jgi:nitrite reductase/ring-hydroxylating ferredoxin subunit
MTGREREELTIPPDGRSLDEQPKWRQDFPIDWPQAQYLSRRDFTKFMVLISLAFTAGQFWIIARNFLRRRRGETPLLLIATKDQLAIGGSLAFNYPDTHDTCLLVRTDEKTFVAYSQKCTHLSCAVVPQPDQNCLNCPCHEGTFDLATGAPIAGPPRRPLPRINLEVRSGVVYATGLEVKTI